MPYSAGGTVEQILAACGRLAMPQALWVARQIAGGLSHLHERGFLHSDVKPANLFVSSTGHATLFDLGLTRSLPLDQSSPIFAGTPNYAAPEWFATTSEVEAASDIYSLGLVLYEMLTGSAVELATRETGHVLSDPRRIVPFIPRNVVSLLRKMLAAQPHQRPTASELVDALVRLEVESIDERCA
jgi:serine/threonine-protein kinase